MKRARHIRSLKCSVAPTCQQLEFTSRENCIIIAAVIDILHALARVIQGSMHWLVSTLTSSSIIMSPTPWGLACSKPPNRSLSLKTPNPSPQHPTPQSSPIDPPKMVRSPVLDHPTPHPTPPMWALHCFWDTSLLNTLQVFFDPPEPFSAPKPSNRKTSSPNCTSPNKPQVVHGDPPLPPQTAKLQRNPPLRKTLKPPQVAGTLRPSTLNTRHDNPES